ncbi:uncharacterized protein N7498_000033 [Penicillium cinerascens]|uniref:Amino acid permease/ SLC12A domain-containing protein n=1 Tax=Penicillium cinerascens TaxID=70096 RepID=A0A9W9NDQ1_9EURO|nr:uncharacterized protein N7498_000033 [Penicillium cinerascens]KAJ5217934.1 hypothetical protein N7498_000033 [Penicillium cinerascens]
MDPQTISEIKVVGESGVVSKAGSSSNNGQELEGWTEATTARQLHRTFKARHVQMICLGGCLGSGIFIGTGKALHYGGAPAIIIGYGLICSMALAVMNVLTEHVCLFPTTGSFIDHAARFVDPALGFAIGFCEWFAWMTVVASEGVIVRVVLMYWTTSIPTAACMAMYLFVVFFVHCFPSRWFGEFEFYTAAVKITAMFIMLFACIAMIAGAGPTGSTDHGDNYTKLPVFPNGFKGVAQTFLLAVWATGGQEIMGITAGEAQRPRWDMPRACKNLFMRIIVFYGASTIFLGILVPYNNPRLLATGTVAASPFAIALVNAGIRVLPDILNAIIILGLVTLGVESVYVSSRVMTAMSTMGMIPRVFSRLDRQGRPYWSLLFTAAWSTTMTFINCSNTGAVIFTWFSSIAATIYVLAWMFIAITNWRLRKAIQVQNDSAWKLPYAFKLSAYPATSVYLFHTSLFVLLSTGYVSLFPIGVPTSPTVFFETFLGVPIFLAVYLSYKVICRTKFVNPAKADLQTGRRPLTEDDILFLDSYYSKPAWRRSDIVVVGARRHNVQK